MKTIRIVLTALILLQSCSTAFSQKKFAPGYVITLDNDTIQGKIKDSFPARSSIVPDKVLFIDKDGKKTKYLPANLKGYSKAGIANYMTIPVGHRVNFAKILTEGEIRLLEIKKPNTYAISSPNGEGNVISTSGSYSSEIFYLYNTSSHNLTRVDRLNFREQMAIYFSDDEETKAMILNKELRFKDIEMIVKKYNQWKKRHSAGNK